MARSLNSQMLRALLTLTLVACVVMYLVLTIYYYWLFDWLYPNATANDPWDWTDFAVVATPLAIGLISAAAVAWHQARIIVRPLLAVAKAARLIAEGNFSARIEDTTAVFGEAETLLADFNAMAARLQQAEAELKYSNSAIAHELRTPLTILRGRLQGLLDGAFEPSDELYARLISHVEDLTRIVEDLRTLGLSSAGRLTLELDTFDLAEEAGSVISAIEPEFGGARIALELALCRAIVLADKAKVRQALLAVLNNACRYAPGSKLLVETGQTDGRAFIRCSDDGPGLPAELLDRAFDRFWRGDASRARISGGSGLGLSVVRAIARAHGGDATITDSGGKGVSVEIWLPAGSRT